MYNLTGNPADKPVEVKCEFTVDNEVLSVEYNDVQLEIKSDVNCTNPSISDQVDDNCVKNWAIMKTFSFLYDGNHGYDVSNFLRIRAENWGPEPNCIWAGLMLHCKAYGIQSGQIVPDSPWHGFKSNIAQWRSQDGTELCANDGGMLEIGMGSPALQDLVAYGAVKIWGGERNTSTLIGSPDFTQGDTTCSMIPSLDNVFGFISCFLETAFGNIGMPSPF